MGMTAMELRRKADGLLGQAEALVSTAESEDRDFTEDEEKNYNELLEQRDNLLKRAERVESVGGLREDSEKVVREAPRRQPITSPKEEDFRSLGEFLQAVARSAGPGAPHDRRLEARVGTGSNIGMDHEGGYLVGAEYASEIIKRVYETGVLAAKCQKTSIGQGTGSWIVNAIDETSRANGSRSGGVRAYWEGEGDAATASRPKFRQMEWKPKKLKALYYATEEVLADADGLEQEASQAFVDEIAFQLDDAIFRGDGAGKPLGFTAAACYVAVTAETSQDADTIVWENIEKMWARMYAKSRANAAWFINQDCEPQLMSMRQVVGMGGVPVYLPAGGASATPYSTLMGRPVIPIEHASTLGDAGDIVLADLTQYKLVDKGGIKMDSSMHVQFLYDEMVYRWVYRVDGQPLWHSALTPYKGSNTQSPFIGLAART